MSCSSPHWMCVMSPHPHAVGRLGAKLRANRFGATGVIFQSRLQRRSSAPSNRASQRVKDDLSHLQSRFQRVAHRRSRRRWSAVSATTDRSPMAGHGGNAGRRRAGVLRPAAALDRRLVPTSITGRPRRRTMTGPAAASPLLTNGCLTARRRDPPLKARITYYVIHG